jgi:hypothetical protein
VTCSDSSANTTPSTDDEISAVSCDNRYPGPTLLAYCGRTVRDESPALTFPNGFNPACTIFNAHRIMKGELYLVRDPLQVLQAFEGGIENVVAFLTDRICPQQFEELSSLMDERKCDIAHLY